MIATAVGIISAAADPCAARMLMIQTMLCAALANAVATANSTAPVRNTRRSPNRSPSRPPSTMNAASGRMFAVKIHWPSPTLPPSP